MWIKNPTLKKRNYFQVHCYTAFYFFSARPTATTIQPPKNCYPKLPSTLSTLQSWEMGSCSEIPERPTGNPKPTVPIPLNLCLTWYQFWKSSCFHQKHKLSSSQMLVSIKSSLFDHWSWHLVVTRKKTKKNCIQTKVTTVEIHGPTFYYNGY